MKTKNTFYIIILAVTTFILATISLYYGSVDIPASAVTDILLGGESEKSSWTFIILQSRIPQTITAILTGAALSVSGLMLQTTFNNPLADSSILGISAGSSLGAALVILGLGGSITTSAITFGGFISVIAGAMAGAFVIMAFILFLSTLIKNNVMLLIAGIMTGYVTSSVISLLNFFSTAEGVHSYITWGMGNFGGVSLSQLPAFTIMIFIGLTISIMLIKPMNALLLGTRYAENLGVNIRRTRNLLLLSTGILTAVTTAFCGPISFIGLAVPHISRLLLGTSNHNTLLPATALCGSAMALLCSIISILPGENGIIPINAVTPVLGAPVIIYVIINQKKIQYFN
ncbi:iron ABC transporter permease [Bacteroides caecigallinarum]|uniref:iron ABC transporter permease n=1 Tax=Bacteroides caecigallinarum TaxID=1411144 RepID=UPI001956430B|nr:iron ABC transporter permease [Bacteroides caecigallinarum]MBM6883556.1 iron ABC transporter permease [Bacteroides caecigallinarum]MBM6889644.1 iron ABC transporter permease [Bacteroides caecigallinarum]MCF2551771.1 iron ABC transporter permease [Bacteroides caecigallinarum]